MSITEITYKLDSPRFYCPNCMERLPPDCPAFTFCSSRCMEEFDDILTPSEGDELDEEEKEEEEH